MLGNRWIGTSACALWLAAAGCGDSNATGEAREPASACGLDAENTKGTTETGSIKGSVSLSPDAKLGAGDLYVAVLGEFDPLGSCPGKGTPIKPVANLLARCVDLGAGSYSFTIEGVPPRAAAYYVIPFLDVNANIDSNASQSAGPDACDLISTVFTQAVVDEAGETVEAPPAQLGPAEILVSFCMLPACEE